MSQIEHCTHVRTKHQHGTVNGYSVCGCRCVECRDARLRRDKRVSYLSHTGRSTYVDAEPVRQHVLTLLATLTVGQIERRSGINRHSILLMLGDTVTQRRSTRIARKTANAILAVSGDIVGQESTGLVDPIGTQRRLRALMAIGWTGPDLIQRTGLGESVIYRLAGANAAPGPIQARTRDSVMRVYGELWDQPGLSERTRKYARQHGWAPPLAWDEGDIDDYNAQPEGVRDDTESRAYGADLDEWAWLIRNGEAPERAAERCGVQIHSIETTARRQGRDDILHLLDLARRAA